MCVAMSGLRTIGLRVLHVSEVLNIHRPKLCHASMPSGRFFGFCPIPFRAITGIQKTGRWRESAGLEEPVQSNEAKERADRARFFLEL